jgi:hypothetical protein
MIFSKLSMGCNGVLTKQVAKHHCLDGSQLHEYTTIAQCYVSTDIGVQRPNNSTISPESIKSLPHPSISVVIVEGCDGISAYSEDEILIVLYCATKVDQFISKAYPTRSRSYRCC